MAGLQTPERSSSSGSDRPSGTQAPASLRAIAIVAAGLIGFALGLLVSAGDDPSPASAELPAVVEAWAEAWMNQDAEAVAATYAEDGLFDGILAVELSGRDEIRAGISEYWAFVGAGDVGSQRLEPEYVFVTGGGATVVWNVENTDEDGNANTSQHLVDYEWDWDDDNLLRTTEMNW